MQVLLRQDKGVWIFFFFYQLGRVVSFFCLFFQILFYQISYYQIIKVNKKSVGHLGWEGD